MKKPARSPQHYWLMKSEPESYSIDDLQRDKVTDWDGVRNYQARNFIRDTMQVGDGVLFYHSNASPPGVAGLARISSEARPDPTALIKGHHHYDPKSSADEPTWLLRELTFVAKFPQVVGLPALRENPKLDGLLVLKRGQRLSIQPVEPVHFREICRMASVKMPF